MGWKQIGPAVAQDDHGAVVRPHGQDRVIYEQGNLRAEVEVEFGGPFVIVYSDSLTWSEPDEGEPMPVAQQQRLLREVLDAMDCMGWDWETRADVPSGQ